MSSTAAPRPADTPATPAWLRATLVQAAWCWLTVALAFGLSRAVVALGSGVAPVPFAAYSVMIFVLIPAVPALVVIAVAAGAQRAVPPAWVQATVVALAMGGWAYFATRSPGWALAYAAAGAIAATIAIVARTRRASWPKAAVMLLGTALLSAAWFGLETLG